MMKNYLNLLCGAAIGIALGLILGLSVSPVVQTFLGIFASILTVFLGVEKPAPESSGGILASVSAWSADKMLRIIGFGGALSVWIILGITLRTYKMLEMPLSQRVKSWRAAGYDARDALRFAALEKLGSGTDQNTRRDTDNKRIAEDPGKTAAVGGLFASKGKFAICDNINIQPGEPDDKVINTIISAYKHDPGKKLIPLGKAIDSLPLNPTDKKKLLIIINQLLCSGN